MARHDRRDSWLIAAEAVDRPLLIVVTLLMVGSVVMVYSASSAIAMEQYHDAGYFLKRQLMWLGLGVVAMVITARMNVWGWQRLAIPLLVVSALLLVLVLVSPLGTTVNGARRWLRVAGWSVQPSELAKLAVVCYLARYLASHTGRIAEFRRGLLPPLVICGALILLVLAEPDFGTAFVIATLTLLLLFIGQARLFHLCGLALAALPAVVLLVASSPYRRQRLLAFLDPWDHAQSSGFQVIQSFLAMGRGGVSGLGLGESRQKLFFLPEPHTDFIFSVIGEELGLIGTVLILLLFMIFFWRGLVIAQRAEEPFLRYLAVGITGMIGVQALLHMAVVIGLLPTKGLTLPLLSYGGSSLLVDLVAVGILLAICRQRVTG
jgi:cell division protein FtsW